MQLIFTFTINPETKEATFAGNVEPAAALQILQDIVVSNAVANAEIAREKAEAARKKAEKPVKEKKK